MKAIKDPNGNITAIEDTVATSSPALSSPVVINKSTSSNKGKLADIVGVRNNKVIVQLSGSTQYRTYDFDQLANS